jgi:hypothetical protein
MMISAPQSPPSHADRAAAALSKLQAWRDAQMPLRSRNRSLGEGAGWSLPRPDDPSMGSQYVVVLQGGEGAAVECIAGVGIARGEHYNPSVLRE